MNNFIDWWIKELDGDALLFLVKGMVVIFSLIVIMIASPLWVVPYLVYKRIIK